jgi:hypothetical protein
VDRLEERLVAEVDLTKDRLEAEEAEVAVKVSRVQAARMQSSWENARGTWLPTHFELSETK